MLPVRAGIDPYANSHPRHTKLIGPSDALALAEYAEQHSPLVVLAASALKAQPLVE